MKRLARLALDARGEVRDDVAAFLLERCSRSQLKEFLAALRREIKRLRVSVALAGEAGSDALAEVAGRYPGRPLDVAPDESLGAGVRVSAGDDIMDASVQGYIRNIIAELGGT